MKKIYRHRFDFIQCKLRARIFCRFLKKARFLHFVFALSAFYLTILSSAVYAGLEWTANGEAICTAASSQLYPEIVSDGARGAIITWYDSRRDEYDIYAQRINADGVVQWTANGVAICTAADDQCAPKIVSDGAGGAIITWYDYRTGKSDIYARRINANGAVQWTAYGQAICTADNNQEYPTIVSDGAGGAIITWMDYRGGNYDIYAQRINADGAVQWTANGVAISTETDNQRYADVVFGAGLFGGEAIITWQDFRSGTDYDIYAQRINLAGVVQWTTNGKAICTAENNQEYPTIVSDGAGGAIITWMDYRGGNYDIYAQRINANGAVQWADNGEAICTAAINQSTATIVSDGAGGAIITWYDNRGVDNDIYAQRINANGVVQWTDNGEAICTAADHQFTPTIVSDGAGGAIITWWDYRRGNYDIYAQRINANGVVQWAANGEAICTAADHQCAPKIVSDGAGGAIITWWDYRSGTNYDIYAQRISRPILEVSTLSFGFGEIPKPASETRTFTISNSGGGTLEGTITADRPWISVEPTSFKSNNVTVFVTAHTDTLEVWKTYTGTVTVDSNGGVKKIDISILPTCVLSYPNPYSLSSGKPLTFWGTGVAYGTIKIYTLSGELVKTLKETNGEDKIVWDGRNENGERIVRGIYFFTTKNPKERNTGKFTVVR